MILKTENLSVNLGGREILKNISFEVEKGDYICIVGENGSGKSTLIKTLLGLIKPKSGKTEFDKNTGRIGYLPQQTDIKRDFPASVWEVVLSGCLNSLKARLFYSKSDKARAEDIMRRLGIFDIRFQRFASLSGGQRQRVLLARAVCASENLILLDEPVTGLDPLVTDELYHLISDLNKEKGITVITVSHDIAASVKYASKILHLGKGEIRFYGKTGDYVNSEIGVHFTGRCCEHV